MFGTEVECWKVAECYRNINIEANSVECDSIRSFNYICGCSDSPGYAGANTDAKKLALVWLPRIGAMMSLLVRDPYGSYSQLMFCASSSDILFRWF